MNIVNRRISRLSTLSTLLTKRSIGMKVNTKIQLTSDEQKISNLLVQFANDYKQKSDKQLTLRITGGWVRDKLLGNLSHDVDIAIDKMTGKQFGDLLNEYIKENADELGIEVGSIHTIGANPEKSKHLETATTKLYNCDIDFVNLRSEEYAEDSRFPVIKFGTPEEDAYRRDATLNALFYNIMEQKIEDFTNKGLEDLRSGVLRTPLEPFNTFNDDPLRVLRLLRFASTFGFQIASDSLEAMKDERINDALMKKISRERVGIEMTKLLSGKYPEIGTKFIADLELEDSIFLLPDSNRPTTKNFNIPSSKMHKSVDTLIQIRSSSSMLSPELSKVFNDPKLYTYIWAMTSLCRWGTTQAVEKKRSYTAANIIVRNGLKWSGDDGKLIEKLVLTEESVAHAAANAASSAGLIRKEIGLLVRACGEQWRLGLMYSLMCTISRDGEFLSDAVARYNNLVQYILQNKLDDAWDLKPIVNGNEIQQAFGGIKPGPWTKRATDKCIEYQLANPDASKQQCLEYLVGMKDEITS